MVLLVQSRVHNNIIIIMYSWCNLSCGRWTQLEYRYLSDLLQQECQTKTDAITLIVLTSWRFQWLLLMHRLYTIWSIDRAYTWLWLFWSWWLQESPLGYNQEPLWLPFTYLWIRRYTIYYDVQHSGQGTEDIANLGNNPKQFPS